MLPRGARIAVSKAERKLPALAEGSATGVFSALKISQAAVSFSFFTGCRPCTACAPAPGTTNRSHPTEHRWALHFRPRSPVFGYRRRPWLWPGQRTGTRIQTRHTEIGVRPRRPDAISLQLCHHVPAAARGPAPDQKPRKNFEHSAGERAGSGRPSRCAINPAGSFPGGPAGLKPRGRNRGSEFGGPSARSLAPARKDTALEASPHRQTEIRRVLRAAAEARS